MHSMILYTAFLPLVIAGVIESRASCKLYDDNYDNIAAPPTVGDAITNYNGLLYQGWNVINQGAPTAPILPHTNPNVIIACTATDLLTTGGVNMYPIGNVLRGTGTSSFNLYSFYFGCTQAGAQSAANLPVGCTIAVTGYNIFNQQIPVATFAFAPSKIMGASLNFATLPGSFSLLKNVTFGIAQGGGTAGATGTVLLVDDLVHCNNS